MARALLNVLASAVASVYSIAAASDAMAQPAPFATAPANGASVPAPIPEPPPPDPAEAAPVEDPPRVAVGAGGHMTFGSLPAVAVGATASAELATRRWALGVEGRYDAPSSAHTTQGASVRASLAGGALVPCLRAKGMWVCGVVLVARVSGDGADDGGPNVHDASVFLAVGGRLLFHVALPADFALRIGGEVLGVPIPYELSLGDHRLFQSSAVAFSVGPSLVHAF